MSTDDPFQERRSAYADAVIRLAGADHPRVRALFAALPRERFLPPPPWTTISAGVATQTSDLSALYENVLVALDTRQGINNGEPALHAAWLATVDPQPGETVVHVGAGSGYYTAMLARLVAPAGRVEAYEVHPELVADAARNLADEPGVTVRNESAFGRKLPEADVVYVNAGVFAPDPEWLMALRPGGRLIFPWQADGRWGPALLVTRQAGGFMARPVMQVGFITCSGQPRGQRGEITRLGIEFTRSVWMRSERAPDRTATAVYDQLWFSIDDVAA
ncbi:MAG TPA: SAM-dependent methyltransferase [Microvirga sp.]|jgi:protein-L-isoaspartate(D-aspartate) O-methyltransferase